MSRRSRLLSSLSVVGAATLVAAACVSDDEKAGVVEPGGAETILFDDFSFEPADIEVVAGSTVTLTLRNVGAVPHEVMIGSQPSGSGGYEVDLLNELGVEIVSGSGYEAELAELALPAVTPVALFEGDHEGEHDDEESGEGTDDTTDTDEAEPPADEGPADEGPADEGTVEDGEETPAVDDHDEAPDDDHHHGEGAHLGGHLLLDPGGEVTVRISIPLEAVGTWEMGCFLEGHYEAGMIGTFTVVDRA